MKILIYENNLNGHHLEYLHHVYMRAADRTDLMFVFVIPEHFLRIKGMMEWPVSNNISFDFITDVDAQKTVSNRFRFIGNQVQNAKLISKAIKKHRPDYLFMPGGFAGIPFIELFLPNRYKTKISCIEYCILPYVSKNRPFIHKLIDWLTYNVALKRNRYNTIFLLNNRKYVDYYNDRFQTSKYSYITDPVTTDNSLGHDLHQELNIPTSDTVFIHIGAMGKGKGTLEILDAIAELTTKESQRIHFIFAGKVGIDIKESFYQKKAKLDQNHHLYVYDKFCNYDFFCSLYKTCDYVLFPYPPRPNSSGLLGNAALFGKPVITVDGGAMGDLVREYYLGYLMPDNSSQSILEAIRNPQISSFSPQRYVEEHTIQEFCDTIFRTFI